MTLITEIPWAILDVETTGLSPVRGDRVCEIAILRAEPDGNLRRFSSLVNPGRPMDPKATAVNGITDLDVQSAPSFGQITTELTALLDAAVLIAHNAPFDISFLTAEYALARVGLPQMPVVDTLHLARTYFQFPKNNLGFIAQKLGVMVTGQHRAAADVETTYHVLRAMLPHLKTRGKITLTALQSAPSIHKNLPGPLGDALVNQAAIAIRYTSPTSMSERHIQPLWTDGKYLIAFCQLRQEQRTFLLEHIVLI